MRAFAVVLAVAWLLYLSDAKFEDLCNDENFELVNGTTGQNKRVKVLKKFAVSKIALIEKVRYFKAFCQRFFKTEIRILQSPTRKPCLDATKFIKIMVEVHAYSNVKCPILSVKPGSHMLPTYIIGGRQHGLGHRYIYRRIIICPRH